MSQTKIWLDIAFDPGKVQILGTTKIQGDKVFVLRFIQGRDPAWVGRPYFAKYNPKAIWLDDLQPFGKERFFFEKIRTTQNSDNIEYPF